MKKMFFSRMAITMMVAAQFLASCSKDDNNEQPTPTPPPMNSPNTAK